MKKLFAFGTIIVLTLCSGVATYSATTITSESTQEVDNYYTTVTPGKCTDMKRDTKYSTTPFYPENGHAYVKVKNCEDNEYADGYTGKADILLEKDSNGSNIVFINNFQLKKGEYKRVDEYNLDYTKYRSSVDWEEIDGQDLSGSKQIYSSVE